MRLIDADALINKFPNAKEKDEKISFNGALADIIMMIEDAPTIEPKRGKWEWFEDWALSTSESPAECNNCGWMCNKCRTYLSDIVGGYWDDPDDKPKLNFCPNCGAKMGTVE